MDQALDQLALTNDQVTKHYPSKVIAQYVQSDGTVSNPEQFSGEILQLFTLINPPQNAQIQIIKAVADDDLGLLKLTVQLVSTVVGFNGTKPTWDATSAQAQTVKSKTREIVVAQQPF